MGHKNIPFIKQKRIKKFNLSAVVPQVEIRLPTTFGLLKDGVAFAEPHRYHGLTIEMLQGGNAVAIDLLKHLVKIKLVAVILEKDKDGKVVYKRSEVLHEFGDGLEMRNEIAQQGVLPSEDNLIYLPFTDPTLRTSIEQTYTALGTADVEELVIHAEIDTGNDVSLASLSVNLYADYDNLSEDIGVYKRTTRHTVVLQNVKTLISNDGLGLDDYDGILQRISIVRRNDAKAIVNANINDVSIKFGDFIPEDVPLAIRKNAKKIRSKGTGSKSANAKHYSRDFNNSNPFTGIDLPTGAWELTVLTPSGDTVALFTTFLCGVPDNKVGNVIALAG